jgi:SAM-dependent methyltransferase
MELLDIVLRSPTPEPWAEGEKIPWDDPAFSARMLREHLSQSHDAASRRASLIDAHVAWIHQTILNGGAARVIDLGCGPGLYTSRLAARGHVCVGIDFSPAAIAYAERQAREHRLTCSYELGDIRSTDYDGVYSLVMLTYGELNVFRPADARLILSKARAALGDGGQLLLEVHTADAVRAMGSAPPTWRSAPNGLFSDRPHLRLDESFWDETQRVSTHRYFVVDAASAAVTRYAESVQAYSEDEYRQLLTDCGFSSPATYPSLSGDDAPGEFVVLIASRAISRAPRAAERT